MERRSQALHILEPTYQASRRRLSPMKRLGKRSETGTRSARHYCHVDAPIRMPGDWRKALPMAGLENLWTLRVARPAWRSR